MHGHDRLVELLATRSARSGQFTLSSGRRSTLYIDVRLTSMSPEGLTTIGPLGLAALLSSEWGRGVRAVGGLTLGADPVSYAISYASMLAHQAAAAAAEQTFGVAPMTEPIRAFTVRKEAKAHGAGRLIEGPFFAGDRVAIVEDVITTGASALRAAEAVRAGGGEIAGVLAVVDREEGGREAIEEAGFPVVALVRAAEIMGRMSA